MENHSFLLGMLEVTVMCARKRFDIPEVKIAFV
jgi:hypothetical protein